MPLFRKSIILLLLLSVNWQLALAQDTLPSFTVKNRFGKIIMGWVNPFDSMVQMNIQRSPDSLKGFKTILAVADPSAVTNGYLDAKAPDTRQFYRIFVMRTGGRYFFTRSYRPVVDSSREVKPPKPKSEPREPVPSSPALETRVDSVVIDPVTGVTRTYKIARNVAGPGRIAGNVTINDSFSVKTPEYRPVYTPSVFVFANPQGDVEIALPESKQHAFTLKFYTEEGKPLFQMSKIRDSRMTLDKSNFIRSGWVQFELYEDGKLKEKRKVYIPKDR